ncbi:MAG: hypothetical protein JO293_09045 [Candidatus Eremiobacteraeota bacterium]|nr:hypothetical protein [Candidatus Eremiobacteraeota bacterium]
MGKLEKDDQADESLQRDARKQPDGSRSTDAYHTSMKRDDAHRIEPSDNANIDEDDVTERGTPLNLGNGVTGSGRRSP